MKDAATSPAVNPWHPMARAIDLAHLGKLSEELCEGIVAVCACADDGIDLLNGAELENEIVDVDVTARLVIAHFRLAYDIPLLRLEYGPRALARLGKYLGNAGAAVSRCIIQGIDECEPVTGKPNRRWLEESLGAVLAAQTKMLAVLDRNDVTALARMARRRERKTAHLQQWHSMLEVRK